MSEQKPKAIYKPGELEETRKHLGDISKEESMRIAKLLGGEVGVEQTPLFDNFKGTQHASYNKKARPSSVAQKPSSASANSVKQDDKSAKTEPKPQKKAKKVSLLPELTSKEKAKFDRLMTESTFKIKRPQNFISFILSIGKQSDRVSEDFVTTILMSYIGHMQTFFTAVKVLARTAGDSYKTRINNDTAQKFRLLRYCSNYNMQTIKDMQRDFAMHPSDITVSDTIPFVKEIYRPILTMFFLGQQGVPAIIKEAVDDINAGLTIKKGELLKTGKEASVEWNFIYNSVAKGLYPLLMRMICDEVLPFARFFNTNMDKILTFLGMTKFDLILPDENMKKAQNKNASNSNKTSSVSENSSDNANEKSISSNGNNLQDEIKQDETAENERDRYESFPPKVKQGLDLLEKLFPEAGWRQIGFGADLYPYFQNIYYFVDGFNLLSENNPMQVTIVLVRILEDLFQGCRNIKWSIDKDPEFSSYNDSISDVFGEWSVYRETLFERDYLGELKKLVNHAYSQTDFLNTPYARKELSSMLWQAKTMFLPYLNYEFFFMEKSVHTELSKSLPSRVAFLKSCFMKLIKNVDGNSNAQNQQEALGAGNILSHYKFEVPNPVSERINSLLGGQKSPKTTNLNLVKYSLTILNVLEWWISDKDSPAYDMNAGVPYRINSEDGSLVFSVPLRTDQIAVFNKAKKERATLHAKGATEKDK